MSMNAFDPYHVWLGIPPAEQPPSHYRLLAIAPLEDSPDVIENAADRQMAHVRRAATGKHADASQKILNEIAAARRCLLDRAAEGGLRRGAAEGAAACAGRDRGHHGMEAGQAPPAASQTAAAENQARRTPAAMERGACRSRYDRAATFADTHGDHCDVRVAVGLAGEATQRSPDVAAGPGRRISPATGAGPRCGAGGDGSTVVGGRCGCRPAGATRHNSDRQINNPSPALPRRRW